MAEDELDRAVTVATALGGLVKDAGDSAEGKRAAANLGKAVVTLTEAVNNCLLPIAAVNYAFTRARDYFATCFKNDIAEATADIPSESLIEPKASVAGPALQGLAFSHDEPQLKELYLQLLATAMDDRHSKTAHPAFVEILKQLTAEEAGLLQTLLRGGQHPLGLIRERHSKGGTRILWKHLIEWIDLNTDEKLVNPDLPAMVDNWVRLGLIEVSYTRWIDSTKVYEWMETRPELVELRAKHQRKGVDVVTQKGLMEPTALGIKFAQAVGISDK